MSNLNSVHFHVVGMGDFRVCEEASAKVITYALGSCLGVTAFDPVAKVGGLMHALLPSSKIASPREGQRKAHFVDTGLIAMFNEIYAKGGVKERLEVKMAGGGNFFKDQNVFNIGNRNVAAARSLLMHNGFQILAEHVGGEFSRTMKLDFATGKVTLSIAGHPTVEL